ncbi:hypothetical protein NC651_032491 [Populus alba x Populus x berolinensis]|nr:hypothetical protein NC651_032491 [Populus alba x Populus x berolinensis]
MKNFVFVQTNFIPLQGDMQNTATWISSFFSKWITKTEIWKQIPPDEPYCVLLGSVRDRLYNALFLDPLVLCYRSLCACGD